MDQKDQLFSHLPFVQKMLNKAKDTVYEESWKNLLDMMQNTQSLTNAKVEVINNTLDKLIQKLEVYKSTPAKVSENEPKILKNDTAQQTEPTIPQKPHHHKKKKRKKGKIFKSSDTPMMIMMSPRREKIPVMKIKLSEVLKIQRQKRERKIQRMKQKAAQQNENITLTTQEGKLIIRVERRSTEIRAMSTSSDIVKKDNCTDCFVSLTRLDDATIQKYLRPSPKTSISNETLNPNVMKEITPSTEAPPSPSVLKEILTAPVTRSRRSKSNSIDPLPAHETEVSVLKSLLNTPEVPSPPKVPAKVMEMPSAPPPRKKTHTSSPPPLIRIDETFKVPTVKPEKSPQRAVQIANNDTSPMTSIPTDLIFPKPTISRGKQILLSAEFTLKKIRPWLKGSSHRKVLKNCEEMLSNGNCLAATFKCMGSSCSFFTNDSWIFKQHLQLHEKYQTQDSENFQKCCYCNFESGVLKDLVDHIFNVHGSNKYQCPYCFYRSYDFHLFTHLKIFHTLKSELAIECVPLKLDNASQNLGNVWSNFTKFCRAIICFVCKSKFFNITNYASHIQKHTHVPSFKCIKCEKEVNRESVIYHLKRCHGFGNFNCAFCVFGDDSTDTIKKHLSSHHPDSLMLYFDRSIECGDGNSKIIGTTSIENIATVLILKQLTSYLMRQSSNIKVFNNKLALNNAENVAKGFDTQIKDERG